MSFTRMVFSIFFLFLLIEIPTVSCFCISSPSLRQQSLYRLQVGVLTKNVRPISATSSDHGFKIETHTPKKNSKWTRILNSRKISLIFLIVQNSALAIFMRMSRMRRSHSNMYYITSTAVVLCEALKLMASMWLYWRLEMPETLTDSEGKTSKKSMNTLLKCVWWESKENWITALKIAIPSGLYTLQNNLQYVAMSNLPAEVYQVLIQSKIITTALVARVMLKKQLSTGQWLALAGLMVGVSGVQLSLPSITKTTIAVSSLAASKKLLIGTSSVLVSCLTSALAGVYLEKIMKSEGGTLMWMRNIQISFISTLFALIGCISKDWSLIARNGFFQGYSPLVWSVIALQALGGLIVAIVVKNTNSIIKGFAASGSVVLSVLVSSLVFQESHINLGFLLGTVAVVISAFVYAVSTHNPQSTSGASVTPIASPVA